MITKFAAMFLQLAPEDSNLKTQIIRGEKEFTKVRNNLLWIYYFHYLTIFSKDASNKGKNKQKYNPRGPLKF